MMSKHNSMERRFATVVICIAVWITAMGGKLVKLQIADHDRLRERAERQQHFSIDLSPKRGVIFDRSGHELARSAQVKSLYASPSKIGDAEAAAGKLAAALGIDSEALLKRLKSNAVMTAVKRKLTDDEVAAVNALDIPGLRFVNETKRFYVNGPAASQVIGFVDVDEHGLGGIELSYDKTVRGQGGRILIDVDAFKNPYDHSVEDSVPGGWLTLTIDTLLQQDAEKALAQAVRSAGAKGGSIVLMKPATGEILALANCPTFDPNKLTGTSDEQRTNRAIESAFEPGSIFKLVTYAAALDEGIIKPSSPINCTEVEVAGRVIRDGHTGTMTAREALAKSSNVAAIKLGLELRKDRLAKYIDRFGFGRRTGVELPGESRGLLRDYKEWEASSLGAIPMGHEIGVTAIQAVAAFAAIANGGEWVQPYLVSQVGTSPEEPPVEHKIEKRRVVREWTANSLKDMLEGVVIHGTGKLAGISGYRAAGKTGTAQKIDEATGRYSKTRYVSSFAGFAPVDNPQIACIVSIDEPRGVHLAAAVAAPVFAKVVADALRLLGVQPAADGATEIASLAGSVLNVYDVSESAAYPYPSARNPSQPNVSGNGTELRREPGVNGAPPGEVMVPDLMGRGVREAAGLCAALGIKLKASGDGVIYLQTPAPGAMAPEGTTCYVTLSKHIPLRHRAAPYYDGRGAQAGAR